MTQRQILGIGGNFYVKPWQPPTLQRHLLQLAGVASPRICLLATATGDNPADIEMFYRHLGQHDCRLSHLNLFNPGTDDFERLFLSQNIIYVGGGATRNLIAIWREWGIDKALRTAWESGVVLAGTSAGSICWFESCITDSLPQKLLPLKCLGFLKGSGCTHYDARPDRPTTFRKLIAEGTIEGPGLATDDDTALHYIDDRLHEVVTARRGATAHRIVKTAMGCAEEALPARYLELS